MIHVWRIATDTPRYSADDLSGKGAELSGGRWNRKGTPAVYASTTIALACLETLVHLGSSALPLNRTLVRIDVPDDVWRARTVLKTPTGWDAIPAGLASIDAGQAWLAAKSAVLLEVPSVIVPEDSNVVINPAHAHVARLKAHKLRKWTYDARFAS